jgi:hypothetical protein
MTTHLSMRRVLAPLPLLLLTSCELLLELAKRPPPEVAAQMPSVTYEDAALVESPSQAQMRATYCPLVVPDPLGVPGSARVLCEGFFGAPASASQMRVSFDLRFKVKNPNHFPIPVAELLTAATVFPEKTAQSLGAACVVFCGPNQPECTGEPGPQSCVAKAGDLRSLKDFETATVNLLIATGISVAKGEKPSLRAPQVASDAEVSLVARFTFGPDALFATLKQVAAQSVEQLKLGKEIVFEIPYRLEGTVWLDVGSLGRAAVGFGPSGGTWVIPTSSIVP